MTEQSVETEGFEGLRRAMVASQLRTTAVNDPHVVRAMGEVPRERHVPADRAAIAYADIAVPLGKGRAMPQPMVTGRLLTEAHAQAGERALVVGSATGYAAAVLAEIGATVTALEEEADLVAIAAAAGLPRSVTLVTGPLAAGWPAAAPYDLIVIDGAVERVPQTLVDQLAEGGRLAAPIGVGGGIARLSIGRKAGGAFGMVPFGDAGAPVLPGFAEPPAFRF
ncbi:MAG: protein-L-isoaspartate O-methyltransferase [Sphingomonas fennica]